MSAYAVMVESVTSGAFWYSFNAPVGTVQSWLSLTAAAPADLNQRLFATSQLVYRDDMYGALTVQITNDSQHVVCAGVGRCVRVGRTSDALPTINAATAPQSDELMSTAGESTSLPPPIDPELDGKQILAAISGGRITAGLFCELLCATVGLADTGVRLAVSLRSWMANPLGAMQGGVVAAIITVTTMLDKLGRRIGTVSATMTGPDDVPRAPSPISSTAEPRDQDDEHP